MASRRPPGARSPRDADALVLGTHANGDVVAFVPTAFAYAIVPQEVPA